LTAKQLQDQKERNQITQEKLTGRQNVPIIKPQIKPDPEIEQELELKRYERAQAKASRDARKEAERKRLGKRSNRPGDASQRSVGFEAFDSHI
jgi:phage protein D